MTSSQTHPPFLYQSLSLPPLSPQLLSMMHISPSSILAFLLPYPSSSPISPAHMSLPSALSLLHPIPPAPMSFPATPSLMHSYPNSTLSSCHPCVLHHHPSSLSLLHLSDLLNQYLTIIPIKYLNK